MNDKTLDLLTRLADKFGTTAEHLWGVLVKQAKIAAVLDFASTAILIVILIAAVRFVKSKTTKRTPDNYGRRTSEWDEDGAIIAWVVTVIAGLMTCAAIYANLSNGITAAFNPEYWALKQILP